MHLVYVLLPVGPPFSTGVERICGFRVFPVSAKAGDNITAPPSDYYSVRGHRGRRVALKTT